MRFDVMSIALAAGLTASLTGAWAESTPSATPAPASSAPAATVVSNTSDAAQDQIVCKSFAPATGSRLGTRRMCQTQRQWDAQEKDTQTLVMHEQTRGALYSTPGR